MSLGQQCLGYDKQNLTERDCGKVKIKKKYNLESLATKKTEKQQNIYSCFLPKCKAQIFSYTDVENVTDSDTIWTIVRPHFSK